MIEECEDSNVTQFEPAWLGRAVPTTSAGFDNCQRFARASNTTASTEDASCPAELFDINTTDTCEHYVYENKDTVAYDFGLACDEWHRTLIGSVRMVAMLLGIPISGFVSDRWGRRPTIIISELVAACLGVLRYGSSSYGGYLVLLFIESAFGCSQYSSIYILIMEMVEAKYRGAAGAFVNSFFSLAQILLALFAWAVPNWRNLTLVLYAPQLLTFCYFWILPESIRWNLSRGNYDAAEAALRKVARINGKQLSEQSLLELRQAAEEEKQQQVKKDKKKSPWLVVQVLRNKPILLRCIVSPLLWITMTMIYYGLSINTTNMFGNKYLNYAAVSLAEIPGCLLAMVLINRVGRRHVLAIAYWVCAACQIAYIFLPKGMVVASLIVYFVGKLCITVVCVTIYVYTSELYPTQYRQSLFNFSSMIGRIGSIIAPLTPAFAVVWGPLPFVLFAMFALLSGLLVLVTPETRGTVLPDNMQQAARLTRTPRPQRADDPSLLASRTQTH